MSWYLQGELANESTYDTDFLSPTGHPVTFVAAAGDNGPPPGYPAASPNVVSVGGTTLSLDANGHIASETGWPGGGSGISAYEPQPSYQAGLTISNGQSATVDPGGNRANPDVAFAAAPSDGFPIYDSYDAPTPAAAWTPFGGTSVRAPQWAALIAIADQWRLGLNLKALNGLSQTLPRLYSMAGTSAFNDITSGGNSTYQAGPGYDLVTGLGSPAANTLINNLANSHLAITAPSLEAAGTAFTVTVTALNGSGNIVTGYRGTVHFAASDNNGGVILPADYSFTAADGGVHVFTSGVKLITAGSQTVTASDNWGDQSGSAAITVSPLSAAKLVFNAPAGVTNGTVFPVTVAALDSFGNTATSYAGTVHITSSDPLAILPANATLNSGVGTFSAMFKTLGNQTITAQDTVSGLSATSNSINSTVYPFVQSIIPTAVVAKATSVVYTVTFNVPVTGVVLADFQLAFTGTAAATLTQVTPLSSSVYLVTIKGIAGKGTLGLNLVDNFSIHDLAGNELNQPSAPLTFQSQQTVAGGGRPVSVAMGDVNGDGKQDLVVANSSDNTVSVLLGNGNGTFQNQQTFATGVRPQSVVLGDVNGDGKLDIAVANEGGTSVSVLLGNGNGTFQAQRAFAAPNRPYSVAWLM